MKSKGIGKAIGRGKGNGAKSRIFEIILLTCDKGHEYKMKDHLPVLNKRAASTCYLNLSPPLNKKKKRKGRSAFIGIVVNLLFYKNSFLIGYQLFLRYDILEPNPGIRSLKTTNSSMILEFCFAEQ